MRHTWILFRYEGGDISRKKKLLKKQVKLGPRLYSIRIPVHCVWNLQWLINLLVMLLNQAEGKKRMKAIGKVDVPQEAFMAVLKLEKEVLWLSIDIVYRNLKLYHYQSVQTPK